MSRTVTEELNEVRKILKESASISGAMSMIGGSSPRMQAMQQAAEDDSEEFNEEAFLEEYGDMPFVTFAASALVSDGLISVEFLEADMSEDEIALLEKLIDEEVEAVDMVEADDKQMKAFELITLDTLRKEKKAGQVLTPPGWIYKLADKLGKHILDIWWEGVTDLFKSGKAFKDLSVADVIRDPSKINGAYGTATRLFKKKFAARYGIEIAPTKERKVSISDMVDQFSSWAGKMMRQGSFLKKHNPEVWDMIQRIMQDKAAVGRAKKRAGKAKPTSTKGKGKGKGKGKDNGNGKDKK